MEFILKDSYLAFIKNSVGCRSYRNLFFKIKDRKRDITKNGKDSCAYFVSSVLFRFGLAKEIHATVFGLLKDLENSGWFEVKKPRKGAILIWEKKKIGENESFHIGFYLDKGRAISNSPYQREIVNHSYNFEGQRKIVKILWHKKLGLQKISS